LNDQNPAVVNETGRERFSLPFFYEPNIDAAVEPLPCTGSPQGRWAGGAVSPAQKLLRGLGLVDEEEEEGEEEGDGAGGGRGTAVGEYFHRSAAATATAQGKL
jgi:hypothetical protein